MSAAKVMPDGWHTILGRKVYIEDGYIRHGISGTGSSQHPVYVYRKQNHSRYGVSGWDREEKISVQAFRAGLNRGTIAMF